MAYFRVYLIKINILRIEKYRVFGYNYRSYVVFFYPSHDLGKSLAEGLGLLKTGSFSLSLSLSPLYPSPLYPFHLSIPFTSLSLSPLYLFHLCLSLSLSLLSLPPSLYLSFYLSFSLSPSFSLLLSLSSLYHSLWRI